MTEKRKILIVDDEERVRETLEGLLFKENYQLGFAVNGQECIRQVEEFDPDVILLDIMMPVMDGYKVCKILKSIDKYQHIPVIMITALSSKQDLVKGLDCGADDFLHKPFNSVELRARIRSLLRVKTQFDELQANMKMRENLANMICHDIRTPLSIIQGMLYFLQKDYPEEKKAEFCSKIKNNVTRINSFLNDMLALAKMKGGNLILHKSEVDINQFLKNSVESHKDIAEACGIDLQYDSDNDQIVSTLLDKNLFSRVLDNLISNALKYSPPDHAILVQLEVSDKNVKKNSDKSITLIRVSDEGPGIPEQDREKVFHMFESSGIKNSANMSFGLGLTFCKMVVEQHGGVIYAGSNQPQGAVITIELRNS